MSILVTGASGFVGQVLIQKLHQNGNLKLIALSRKAVKALHNDVRQLVGDDIFSIQWPEDIDVVIHLAGRVHILNEQTTDPLAEFRKINV